ncbi:MAG: hypothetical protein QM690_03595 [Sphingobium sp.]
MTMPPAPGSRGCVLPEAALVEKLKSIAPIRTDKGLAEKLGISYNTWRKMMAGEPVRRSLLERLEDRVRRLDASL